MVNELFELYPEDCVGTHDEDGIDKVAEAVPEFAAAEPGHVETHLNCVLACRPLNVYGVVVAPGIFCHVEPPFVDVCHW